MKIAYMLSNTHGPGGMSNILLKKTSYLIKKGGDITIITTSQKKNLPTFYNFSDKLRYIDLGINYLEFSDKPLLIKLFAKFFKARKHKKRLAEVLHKEKFDIVISMFEGEVRFLCDIDDGSRKIAEIHFAKQFRLQRKQSSTLSVILNKLAMKVDESIVSKLDKFVVLTDEDKSDWPNKHNITRIYNFVDIPKEISTLNNKRAIAVGRLDYQKGFDTLIDIWAIVNKKYPDWKLDIYGSGSDKDKLQEQISRLGLNGMVIINDAAPEIYSKMQDSSMYLMTSRYEGFGLVLAEANACGVPAVSFECKCGPRDIIIDGESGFLVPQDDTETFADRVCQMIENESLRKEMGANARKRIEENFSEEVVMKQWEEIFHELVNEK
ncbi:MAG: glycosyltransferase family 4 protein [Rikenellaceae bacterium]